MYLSSQSFDTDIRILTDTNFVVFRGENPLLAPAIERFTLYIWSLTRLEVSHMHFLPLTIALKRYTFGIKQRWGSHHNWIPRYHYCLILADSFLNKSLSCCRLGGKDNSLPICMRRKGFYIQRRPSQTQGLAPKWVQICLTSTNHYDQNMQVSRVTPYTFVVGKAYLDEKPFQITPRKQNFLFNHRSSNEFLPDLRPSSA